MNVMNFHRCVRFLLRAAIVALLVLGGFASNPFNASALAAGCDSVTDIEGAYSCTGGCAVTDGRSFFSVCGETDTVRHYPAGSAEFYEVTIEGKGGFFEVEIGPLVGTILRTSTSYVSDGIYPVLEDYVFDTDSSCRATGFTKIVRNPTKENFKSCVVHCPKNAP